MSGGENPAIRVEGVGKRYTKYEDTPMLVSRALRFRNRTRRSKLWALRDATFSVMPGECVGIVGRNGSGKSTLLQVLSGITAPTEGRVVVRGRVAPLISVGVGFHPELTGRENVYVNASILGLPRSHVDERLEEIVAFAEIDDFMDTPAKFYSSGMFVRLGFAASVLADPDVLLVDEVLAVGDLAFQTKCFERMDHLRANGTTIILVTHNLNAIQRLCPRTLVIHRGELRVDGPTPAALSTYHDLLSQETRPGSPDDGPKASAEIIDMDLLTEDGQPGGHVQSGQRLTIRAGVDLHGPIDGAILALRVVAENGVMVYNERWMISDLAPADVLAGSHPLRIDASFDARLATGSYSAVIGLAWPDGRLATVPPVPKLFYVAGRPPVQGTNDLHGSMCVTAGHP